MEESRSKTVVVKGTREHATVEKKNSHPARSKKPSEKTKASKPGGRTKKTVYHWGNAEVLRWLRKHQVYYSLYSQLFQEHDLSGRALVRLDPVRMETMGITDPAHRADLLEHILRLRLKHEQNELKIQQCSQLAASS